MQLSNVSQHVVLWAADRGNVVGLIVGFFDESTLTAFTLDRLFFLAGLLAIALGSPGATAQRALTFWASSPLRPGATSNSTA